MAQKKEKEKKNNHKNSGDFVPLQRLRAAHALRSDQFRYLFVSATPFPLYNIFKRCKLGILEIQILNYLKI